MPKINRFSGCSDWITLSFVERERTPCQQMALGIRFHLAELSILNTVLKLEKFGVERSHKVVHDWVQKADLQPVTDANPNHVTFDETVIRIDGRQYWLYAEADPETNKIHHTRLFSTTTTVLTERFLRESIEKHDVENAVFLVDGTQHLQSELRRRGLRFRYEKQENWDAIERIFREIKRCTSLFSNCFSHVKPSTAESWLQSFAV
ncbi:Transposase and inactivated derivatives-like protein (plasmid) [Haloterrigena turkmenica DSM 5511]|uniref:Transposase and inactivated derivatives-like protein n=1 Tax=Haloterrigena turkmenica (strain ATCC 51198 / DSM 5511 / JCM 9101 / NCIMB 13204 / VKM B-1734 / 4k) TaxID=543526 RepID=D2S0Z1_HALTV|nr:IS6 family transposase [Haloterrigena turkmenica]ADB63038.1 Transposase and inactivated derivatives-like protein [Haloterrigena turkmenica DSM 5511]